MTERWTANWKGEAEEEGARAELASLERAVGQETAGIDSAEEEVRVAVEAQRRLEGERETANTVLVVLPLIAQESKKLLDTYRLDEEEARSTVEVLVPSAYTLPTAGTPISVAWAKAALVPTPLCSKIVGA